MCIAYLALATDPQWPLFIAANRDEFHNRPTLPLGPWSNQPDIYAGLDLEAGGTWFAINKNGRFALLTNHRHLNQEPFIAQRSRGFLCKEFVESTASPLSYLHTVQTQSDLYAGFNLVVGQWDSSNSAFTCYYFSNHLAQPPKKLTAGYYVLSNHFLNTPWPKSQRLEENLTQHLRTGSPKDTDTIFQLLKDNTLAPEHLLPRTGLSLERERLLSSPFIISKEYGTRSSSVWAVDQNGRSIAHESSYNADGVETERHSWPIQLLD